MRITIMHDHNTCCRLHLIKSYESLTHSCTSNIKSNNAACVKCVQLSWAIIMGWISVYVSVFSLLFIWILNGFMCSISITLWSYEHCHTQHTTILPGAISVWSQRCIILLISITKIKWLHYSPFFIWIIKYLERQICIKIMLWCSILLLT